MDKEKLKHQVLDAVIAELDDKMSARWAPKKKAEEPKDKPEDDDEEEMGVPEMDD